MYVLLKNQLVQYIRPKLFFHIPFPIKKQSIKTLVPKTKKRKTQSERFTHISHLKNTCHTRS